MHQPACFVTTGNREEVGKKFKSCIFLAALITVLLFWHTICILFLWQTNMNIFSLSVVAAQFSLWDDVPCLEMERILMSILKTLLRPLSKQTFCTSVSRSTSALNKNGRWSHSCNNPKFYSCLCKCRRVEAFPGPWCIFKLCRYPGICVL